MSGDTFGAKVPLLKRVRSAWNGKAKGNAASAGALSTLTDFHNCLIKERARSDRSGDTFSLVIFSVDGGKPDAAVDRVFEALAQALASRTRICDSKGWYNSGVGLILPNTAPELVPNIVAPVLENVQSRLAANGEDPADAPELRYEYYSYPTKVQARMRQQFVTESESRVKTQAEECDR